MGCSYRILEGDVLERLYERWNNLRCFLQNGITGPAHRED